MAAPNIVNVTTILGKTDVQAIGVTATAITTNSAASGKVLKVGTLLISNITTSSADVTVDIYRSATAYRVVKSVSVSPGSTLNVITKNNPIYLEESDTLRLTASVASSLEGICSYEEIS